MSGLSIEHEHQIRELIVQGQKIAAIKLYRDVTGSGLKDAKEAVEAMEIGAAISFPETAQVGTPDEFLDNRIKHLLAEHKKIEAVKVYREDYNCGLKEAKEAVDAIEMQMRMGGASNAPSALSISNDPFAEDTQRNRSCLALVVAIVIVVLGGAAFLFLSSNGF